MLIVDLIHLVTELLRLQRLANSMEVQCWVMVPHWKEHDLGFPSVPLMACCDLVMVIGRLSKDSLCKMFPVEKRHPYSEVAHCNRNLAKNVRSMTCNVWHILCLSALSVWTLLSILYLVFFVQSPWCRPFRAGLHLSRLVRF